MQRAASAPSVSEPGSAIRKTSSAPSLRGCVVFLRGVELRLTEEFLEEHPGGRDIVEVFAGRDITREFDEAGHSASAHHWALRFAVPGGGRRGEAVELAKGGSSGAAGRSRPSASRAVALLSAVWNEVLGDGETAATAGSTQKQVALLEDGLPLTLGLISFASAFAAWHLRAAAWS